MAKKQISQINYGDMARKLMAAIGEQPPVRVPSLVGGRSDMYQPKPARPARASARRKK